jgi:hypothetical protein
MSVSPVTPSPPPIAASPTDHGLTITPENRNPGKPLLPIRPGRLSLFPVG